MLAESVRKARKGKRVCKCLILDTCDCVPYVQIRLKSQQMEKSNKTNVKLEIGPIEIDYFSLQKNNNKCHLNICNNKETISIELLALCTSLYYSVLLCTTVR